MYREKTLMALSFFQADKNLPAGDLKICCFADRAFIERDSEEILLLSPRLRLTNENVSFAGESINNIMSAEIAI